MIIGRLKMEVRKVMLLGRSSFVVSLPKEWIKFHKLKRGDVVSIDVRRDGSLIIYPKLVEESEDSHVKIDVNHEDPIDLITRKIIACYLNGCGSIEIKSSSIFTPTQRKAIRNVAGRLYLRIMEASSNHVYLQSLLDESKVSVNMTIRRMHLIAYSMCKDAIKALKNMDLKLAKTVYSMDDDVDLFTFLILRILRSAIINPSLTDLLDISPIDCMDYQVLVRRIEHVADSASSIAKTIILLSDVKEKIPEETMNLLVKMGDLAIKAYENAVESFFAKDIEKANLIINLEKEIGEFSMKILESISEIENAYVVCAVCSIRDHINRIGSYAADIAEATMNNSLCFS